MTRVKGNKEKGKKPTESNERLKKKEEKMKMLREKCWETFSVMHLFFFLQSFISFTNFFSPVRSLDWIRLWKELRNLLRQWKLHPTSESIASPLHSFPPCRSMKIDRQQKQKKSQGRITRKRKEKQQVRNEKQEKQEKQQLEEEVSRFTRTQSRRLASITTS